MSGKKGANGGMAPSTTATAPAKLNLNLRVSGQTGSGMHRLQSLVVFPEIGDLLQVSREGGLRLQVKGKKKDLTGLSPSNMPNLVLRAAQALQQKYHVKEGAFIDLAKHLPVGAGLGGGSTDAAAALRTLSALWRLNCSERSLRRIGESIGADVAVCLHGKAAWVSGTGEKLAPVRPIPEFWVVLAYPAKPVMTADAFRWLAEAKAYGRLTRRPAKGFDSLDGLLQWLGRQGNSFDAVVLEQVPECLKTRKAIEEAGALYSSMSGSGSAQFGVFASREAAEAARAAVAKGNSAWWVAAARVPPVD